MRTRLNEYAASNVRLLNPDGEQVGEIKIARIERLEKFQNRLCFHKPRAEKKLFKALKREINNRHWWKYGVKVYSQFIIHTPRKSYIADIFISRIGLVVEVDGGYHTAPEQKQKDEERTRDLELMGFRVIRFTNKQIKQDLPGVVGEIIQIIKSSNWN